jgi:hypothetical protein
MSTDRPKQGEKTEPNGNRRDRSPKKIRIELSTAECINVVAGHRRNSSLHSEKQNVIPETIIRSTKHCAGTNLSTRVNTSLVHLAAVIQILPARGLPAHGLLGYVQVVMSRRGRGFDCNHD